MNKDIRNAGPVDLHVHSTKSDGTFTPKQLVDYAIEKGLSAFALTDHDTTDGLPEILDYAKCLRKQHETGLWENVDHSTSIQGTVSQNDTDHSCPVPEVIPGIELSTEYQGRDIHIVGLYIDYENQTFQDKLQNFIDSRTVRNQKMCALLQGAGFDITYEKLLDEFPDAVITRAHYAKYLLNHGYIKSLKEAFDRYVGDHCPYFVPREKVTPAQAVEMILNADGIPILAHPVLYHMSDARLDELVGQLKGCGLRGIEAIYSTYSVSDERHIRSLAAKYNLLLSGGSDFHGANKPGLDLGNGYGKLYVPREILENIKKVRER